MQMAARNLKHAHQSETMCGQCSKEPQILKALFNFACQGLLENKDDLSTVEQCVARAHKNPKLSKHCSILHV